MARGLIVFLFGFAALLFALATGWQPLFQLALGLFCLVLLCGLWVLNGLLGLSFQRLRPVQKTQVGQTTEDDFVLGNRSLLPKLGLEIRDHSTLPGHDASGILDLGVRRQREGGVTSLNELRGVYTLGPTGAAAADPFGLFRL